MLTIDFNIFRNFESLYFHKHRIPNLQFKQFTDYNENNNSVNNLDYIRFLEKTLSFGHLNMIEIQLMKRKDMKSY